MINLNNYKSCDDKIKKCAFLMNNILKEIQLNPYSQGEVFNYDLAESIFKSTLSRLCLLSNEDLEYLEVHPIFDSTSFYGGFSFYNTKFSPLKLTIPRRSKQKYGYNQILLSEDSITAASSSDYSEDISVTAEISCRDLDFLNYCKFMCLNI